MMRRTNGYDRWLKRWPVKNRILSSISGYELKTLTLTILLVICGSLGLDIHLASMPHIMKYMHTNKQHMQQSVTLFILGVALSILIYGPLSDKVGRKPVILFGMGLACVSSFLTATTSTISTFLILRLLQGVGSGVCWGMGRIVAADVMQGERLAAIGSYFTLFLSLSPMLAPAIGGYMQHWFGWQSNFVLLGGTILVVFLCLLFYLDETNRHKKQDAFKLKPLLLTYLSFFKEKTFVGCTLLTGVAMSANIVYVAMSSFIFQHEFHVTPITFGWLTAIVGLASILGKLISPFFIYQLKRYKSLILGLILLLFSGVLLFMFILYGYNNKYFVIVSASLTMFGIVLIGSITMSMALSPFHDRRGAAGALFGSFQLLISFIASAFATSISHGGSDVLSGSYIVLGLLGFLVYFTLIRGASGLCFEKCK